MPAWLTATAWNCAEGGVAGRSRLDCSCCMSEMAPCASVSPDWEEDSATGSAGLKPSGTLGLCIAGCGNPWAGRVGGTGAKERGPSAMVAGWRAGEGARPAAFC